MSGKAQRSQLPTLTTSKTMLLNMASSRTIWLRIDYNMDVINEPIAINFDELDNIDDLKTKILKKLSDHRFGQFNDNASIAIGLYNIKESGLTNMLGSDINVNTVHDANNNSNTHLESPLFVHNNKINFLSSKEESVSSLDKMPFNYSNNVNSNLHNSSLTSLQVNERSPKRMHSTSPNLPLNLKITIPPKYILSATPNRIPYGKNMSTNSLNNNSFQNISIFNNSSNNITNNNSNSNGNNNFNNNNNTNNNNNIDEVNNVSKRNSINSILMPSFSNSSNNLFRSFSYSTLTQSRKPLKFNSEEINGNINRITFQPDQLITELYLELFGSLGQQSSQQPLLIFSTHNLSMSSNHHDSDGESVSSSMMNDNENIYKINNLNIQDETNNSTSSRMNSNDPSPHTFELRQGTVRESPPNDEYGEYDHNNNNNTNSNNSNTLRDDYNYETENSNSNSNSPKQAVLLLPKDYYKKLNANSVLNDNVFDDENSNKSILDENDFSSFKDPRSLLKTANASPSSSTSSLINLTKDISYPDDEEIFSNRLLPPLNEQEVGLINVHLDEWRRQQKLQHNRMLLNDSIKETEKNDGNKTADNTTNTNTITNDTALSHKDKQNITSTPNSSINNSTINNNNSTDMNTSTKNGSNYANQPANNSGYYNDYANHQNNTSISSINYNSHNSSVTKPSPLNIVNYNRTINGSKSNTSDKVFPKINVLIVEDNVINQAILGSFLRKHKISYKIAKNGKEAVDIWKEGGLHLIFMDLKLPVLSGIEAAKQIRDCEKKNTQSQSAPVIIVALTASNSIADKRKALVSGCNDYLTKPVNLHWLSKKITEWGCMQALIDFDNWKQGQSRMSDNVLIPSPQKTKTK